MKPRTMPALAAALALGACASAPRTNAAIDAARTAVHGAEADPNVNNYAVLDLSKAKEQLDVAEQAYLHHNQAVVDQASYMAAQTAKLAQVHAVQKADDARVAAGQVERDRIELAARTRQLATARTEAASAKMAAVDSNIQAERLQTELDALRAMPTPRGMVLTLGGDVLFDSGRAELKAGAGRKLDQLAQFLNEHPDRKVEIDGFTDSVGSDSYNSDLSQRRAESVKSALRERKVDGSRIVAEGFGKSYPVASNNDSGGRQLNRRVEVVIGQQGGTAISPRS